MKRNQWNKDILCLPRPVLRPFSAIPAKRKEEKHNEVNSLISWHRELIFRRNASYFEKCNLILVQHNLGNMLLYHEIYSVKVNKLIRRACCNFKTEQRNGYFFAELKFKARHYKVIKKPYISNKHICTYTYIHNICTNTRISLSQIPLSYPKNISFLGV